MDSTPDLDYSNSNFPGIENTSITDSSNTEDESFIQQILGYPNLGEVIHALDSYSTVIPMTPDPLPTAMNNSEFQIVPPENYAIHLPTKFQFVPLDNRFPTIEVMMYNVMHYEKKISPTQSQYFLIYHGQIETPPCTVDVTYQDEWKYYKEMKLSGDQIDPQEDWLNQPVWASIRWFASLCGCDLDSVRIRVYDDMCKIRGGYQWVPYSPSKIVWITPLSTLADKMRNPKKYGICWVKKDGNWSYFPSIGSQIIHNFWKKRGGTTNLINPPYPDGKCYSTWTHNELVCMNVVSLTPYSYTVEQAAESRNEIEPTTEKKNVIKPEKKQRKKRKMNTKQNEITTCVTPRIQNPFTFR